MALAELENRPDTIYVSTGGGFGPATEAALLRLATGKEAFSAFDNDAAGDAMHEKMLLILPRAERYAPTVNSDVPNADCKDWLDVLMATQTMLLANAAHDSKNLQPISKDFSEEVLSNDA